MKKINSTEIFNSFLTKIQNSLSKVEIQSNDFEILSFYTGQKPYQIRKSLYSVTLRNKNAFRFIQTCFSIYIPSLSNRVYLEKLISQIAKSSNFSLLIPKLTRKSNKNKLSGDQTKINFCFAWKKCQNL